MDREAVQSFLDGWTRGRNVAALVHAMELEMDDPPEIHQVRYALKHGLLRWPGN